MTTAELAQFTEKKIRLCWDSQDFIIGKDSPGKAIEVEFKYGVQSSLLYPMFMVTDEIIFCLRYITYYLLMAIAGGQKKNALPYLKINEAMCSNLFSIRLLCSYGFDNEARTLLRYLYELSIIRSLFDLDPKISAEFELASENKAANAFWHKYLAKDRALKLVRKESARRSLHWLGDINSGERLDTIRQHLGLSAHPTNIATQVNWGHLVCNQSEWLVVRGPLLESSFTLNAAMFLVAMAHTTQPIYEFNVRATIDPKVGPPPNKVAQDFREYTNKIVAALCTLWGGLYLTEEKLKPLIEVEIKKKYGNLVIARSD